MKEITIAAARGSARLIVCPSWIRRDFRRALFWQLKTPLLGLIAPLLGNVPSVPLTRVVLRNTLVLSLLVYLPVGSHNGWVEQVRACS